MTLTETEAAILTAAHALRDDIGAHVAVSTALADVTRRHGSLADRSLAVDRLEQATARINVTRPHANALIEALPPAQQTAAVQLALALVDPSTHAQLAAIAAGEPDPGKFAQGGDSQIGP